MSRDGKSRLFYAGIITDDPNKVQKYLLSSNLPVSPIDFHVGYTTNGLLLIEIPEKIKADVQSLIEKQYEGSAVLLDV